MMNIISKNTIKNVNIFYVIRDFPAYLRYTTFLIMTKDTKFNERNRIR